MKITGMVFVALLGLLALTWIIEGNEFFLYQFFAPKRAAVERRVFENTKSYNQGMAQQLGKMYVEYQSADIAGRAAICGVVRHDYADYPDDRLPSNLVGFLNKCGR